MPEGNKPSPVFWAEQHELSYDIRFCIRHAYYKEMDRLAEDVKTGEFAKFIAAFRRMTGSELVEDQELEQFINALANDGYLT